jgi:hypothetical protein
MPALVRWVSGSHPTDVARIALAASAAGIASLFDYLVLRP